MVSFAISFGGAGLWPGLGETLTDNGYFKALEFPRAAIRDVDVGKGWSKGGLEIVLLPYKAEVDRMAGGKVISFFAPDEAGREARFAMDMYSPECARDLAGLPVGRSTA